MTLFLGVNAGGTSSKSRLTDMQGNILGTGHAGPANTRIGLDALHTTLLDVSMQAIQAAGLGSEDIGNIRCGMGIAGITRMGMKPKI